MRKCLASGNDPLFHWKLAHALLDTPSRRHAHAQGPQLPATPETCALPQNGLFCQIAGNGPFSSLMAKSSCCFTCSNKTGILAGPGRRKRDRRAGSDHFVTVRRLARQTCSTRAATGERRRSALPRLAALTHVAVGQKPKPKTWPQLTMFGDQGYSNPGFFRCHDPHPCLNVFGSKAKSLQHAWACEGNANGAICESWEIVLGHVGLLSVVHLQ